MSIRDKTIGIVGNGFVGSAIAKGFTTYVKDVCIYDIDLTRSAHELNEVLSCDFIFVCLPTPMDEDGSCDLSHLYSFFADIADKHVRGVIVIKSTVPVGTTKQISHMYPEMKLLHSPEFLTARTAYIDFITPTHNLVGVTSDAKVGAELVNLYMERFSGVATWLMSSDETEMVKYVINTFFATKVLFFNEIQGFCSRKGVSFDNVIGSVLSDGRIAHSHTQVPGHDGKFGVGGACLPKDLSSLIVQMKSSGMNPIVLEAVQDLNNRLR